MKHITLGTAGHIDHGKTALVKSLTGTDTDRLLEEKNRGMTIELGFASLNLPSGDIVSIVDVPGHEKFVKTMVAGVTGIDLVLLVISADEGIMPQTKEHIDILSVLKIHTGVVVLTKADLVDETTIQSRREEITLALQGTSLEGMDILPVSSVTSQGLAALFEKIDFLAAHIPEKSHQTLFRMPVDRIFSMTGHGTVVTGTVFGGRIGRGDPVVILPKGLTSKVRSIQVRNQSVEEAVAGDRCALNLAGIEKEDLERGSVITLKDKVEPVTLVDVAVEISPGGEDLVHNQRVHVHTGTSAVVARVRMLGGDRIEPMERGYAQLRLEEPIVALRGDRFILRTYSPVKTLGGGKILFHHTHPRKRFDLEGLANLAKADQMEDGHFLRAFVLQRTTLIDKESLYLETLVDPEIIERLLHQLVQEKVLYPLEKGKYASISWLDAIYDKTLKTFQLLYRKQIYRYQLPKGELKSRVFQELSVKEYAEILGLLQEQEKLQISGQQVWIDGIERISEIMSRKEVQRVRKLFEDETLFSVSPSLVAERIGLKGEAAEEILRFLTSVGILINLEDNLVVGRKKIHSIYQQVAAMMEKDGTITAAGLRDALGISRKEAIAFLEFFDKKQVTLRDGNDRSPGPSLKIYGEFLGEKIEW